MFLSRCEINPRRRGARPLLGSPQALHAAVRFAFPGDTGASEAVSPSGRVLWRLDSDGQRYVLYTVSLKPPDFTHVVEDAGWPATTGWDTRDYSAFLGGLGKGQSWQFRLTANPVRSGRRDSEGRTQRFGHVTVEQQALWLVSRCSGWGFELPTASQDAPSALVRQRSVQSFARQGKRITLATATFEGVLRVSDPLLFREALVNGMGHAKAYGCGLMTLAPVRP